MIRLLIRALTLLFLLLGGLAAHAQDSSVTDEPDFIVPSRPTVSNPAEFQRPGVLQLEFGFNANFRGPDNFSEEDFPLALRFFGLVHDAPRVGLFAGMTVGVADLYRRHRQRRALKAWDTE